MNKRRARRVALKLERDYLTEAIGAPVVGHLEAAYAAGYRDGVNGERRERSARRVRR